MTVHVALNLRGITSLGPPWQPARIVVFCKWTRNHDCTLGAKNRRGAALARQFALIVVFRNRIRQHDYTLGAKNGRGEALARQPAAQRLTSHFIYRNRYSYSVHTTTSLQYSLNHGVRNRADTLAPLPVKDGEPL